MDNVQISVGITFYNQYNSVDKTISSVIEQITSFSYEILIGDDGSTDGTWEKILEWSQKYPEIISTFRMNRDDGVKPTGFRASRNRLNLLKHVRGKYFIFLDGDDYYIDNEKLQKQFDILERKENADCMVCAHDIVFIYPDGREKPKYGLSLPEGKYTGKEYWPKLYFHTNTELIRSLLIKEIDYNLVENNYNDNFITYISFQKGSIYYIPDAMASYVQTGKGIWTGQKKTINLLRNVFIYDLANQINPDYSRETDVRFRDTWKELYKIRKAIDNNDFAAYEREAIQKKMKYSLAWINYNKSGIIAKAFILCKALRVELTYRRYIWNISRNRESKKNEAV